MGVDMAHFHAQRLSLLKSRQQAVFCCLGLSIFLGGSGPAFAQDAIKAAVPAQSAGEKSVEENLKEIERERDDLKRRNADLEQRLKQLDFDPDLDFDPSANVPALLVYAGFTQASEISC